MRIVSLIKSNKLNYVKNFPVYNSVYGRCAQWLNSAGTGLNGVPAPVSGVPPPEIAVPPPKVVVPPPGNDVPSPIGEKSLKLLPQRSDVKA